MITFSEILRTLNETWREQPRRVRILAARYYAGGETIDTLRSLTRPQHVRDGLKLSPLLTESQAEFIISMR